MARSVYEIVIDAQYKGQGAKQAAKDTKSVSLAVEVAAQKTRQLESQWKSLASQVAKGEKSFKAAEKEADDLTRQMKELDKASDGAGDGVEKSSKSFSSFAGQAAAAGGVLLAAGLAAKQAYEYIGQGAELSAATGRFDNLAVSIGTVGDTLLGKMSVATKGMISQADLVASGADIMSLGLAKTEEGVVRMASAVGALDLDMQVLALTLANDSTARLDNLGLSLEAVTKRKKELIASGFIGDAFDEAVLIELEQKMLLLGDASETTAGKIKILEANFTNLEDGMSLMVAESKIVAAGIDNLSGVIAGFNTLQEEKMKARDELTEAVRRGIVTDEEAEEILRRAMRGQDEYVEKLAEVRSELQEQTEASAALSSTAEEVNAIMEEKARILEGLAEDEARHIRNINLATEASEYYIASTAELDDKFRQQSAALTPLEQSQRAAAQATREHAEATAELLAEANAAPTVMETYNAALEASDRAGRTGAAGQEVYRQSMQDLADNTDIAAQRVENLTMKILGVPPAVASRVDVDVSEAEANINRILGLIGSLGAARAVGGEGDIFGGSTAVEAGGVGGNIGETAANPFASGSSGTPGMSQRIGETDFDPLGRGYANGGDFVVPSGFPNDSYPIRVQSGERVTVQTPQQQRDGGGGNTFNFYGMDIGDVRQLLKEEGVTADGRNRMR